MGTLTTTDNDFNYLIGQAAIEKKWKIVDALLHKDIEFDETTLQTLLIQAFKQRKKSILYGIMFSPFIDLEKSVLHGIENSDENFVNYMFRHNDFNEDFIITIFKRVVQNYQLRVVRLLLQDDSYSIDIRTILEAREILQLTDDVALAKIVQDIFSLLNQRLDTLASKLANSNGLVYMTNEAVLCHTTCTVPSCPGYHTTSNFLWQISLGGTNWLSIPQNLVSCLEKGYCDPSRDGIALPRLDPSKPLHAELLCILGRQVWKADFTDNFFKLKNAESTRSLFLRRLYKDIPTLWYYQEDNGNWAEFTGNMTSDVLENLVMQNLGKINFQNNRQNYEICFKSMTQRNLFTGKTRPVKRRPKRINNSDSEDSELHELLPHTWDEMSISEVVKRVELDPWSTEFKQVYSRIVDNKPASNFMVKIERIQNPYLWRTFQNRLQEMTAQSCNPVVLKLFHGTSEQNLGVICQENIDYRMYINRGGYGTLFYPTASQAELYSQRLNFISPVIILAQVAVGTPVTKYDNKLTRPPISDVTKLPFDTAVDIIGRPSFYVKYEAQEYYPEYIIRIIRF